MANPKRPRDTNQLAKRIVDISVGEVSDVESKKAASGRAGGLKGGKARAKRLTHEERVDIARLAAEARWKKRRSRLGQRPTFSCGITRYVAHVYRLLASLFAIHPDDALHFLVLSHSPFLGYNPTGATSPHPSTNALGAISVLIFTR